MANWILDIVKKTCNRLLGVLYPRTCCFCGKISIKELCDECRKKVIYIDEPRCKKCGKPVRYEEQEFCYDCQKRRFYYEEGRSIWLHKEPVSWSVYQFKYHNRRIYGEFYAREMYRLFGALVRKWGIEVIIPVPLHWKRRRVRGYNQAEVLARHLGMLLEIPVDTKAIVRKSYTKPQKQLGDKERKKNLQNAFALAKEWPTPRKILLIDDIYTTGSTVDEIARLFKEQGNHKVWFFTISIGQGF